MESLVTKSILSNKFLPNYHTINDYFDENNLFDDDNNFVSVDGGFTLSFCPSVAKQLFKKNLKTQPEDWYYRTNPVKYTLNSSGYRTKEFDDIDWKESIVMFGCSFVFGIGVTDEHTIPYFLEQLSGRPVVNMGIAGSSIQTALHNSIILNDSEYPTPKAVVYLWTSLDRFQIYKNKTIENLGLWSTNYAKEKFYNKMNKIQFNLMNIKMIRNLWDNKTIYYEGTIFGQHGQHKLINTLSPKISCKLLRADQSARDLGHPGRISNHNVAKKIYENIKGQLNN